MSDDNGIVNVNDDNIVDDHVDDDCHAVWSWLRQLVSRSASRWQSCRQSWWASRTASVSLKASWPRMRP